MFTGHQPMAPRSRNRSSGIPAGKGGPDDSRAVGALVERLRAIELELAKQPTPAPSGQVSTRVTERAPKARIRQWTRRPGSAIFYGAFARFADWWCAGRDARQGMPVLNPQRSGWAHDDHAAPAEGREELRTPRMMFLGQFGLGKIEKEWLRYKRDVAHHLTRLTEARTRRNAVEAAIEMAHSQLTTRVTTTMPTDPPAESAKAERPTCAEVSRPSVASS